MQLGILPLEVLTESLLVVEHAQSLIPLLLQLGDKLFLVVQLLVHYLRVPPKAETGLSEVLRG